MRIALMPIITDRVRKDISIPVECRGRDGSSDLRITLKTVLCILVPEVEGTIRASGAKSTMNGVKRDGVDRVDILAVALVRRVLAVAFEGEVGAKVTTC